MDKPTRSLTSCNSVVFRKLAELSFDRANSGPALYACPLFKALPLCRDLSFWQHEAIVENCASVKMNRSPLLTAGKQCTMIRKGGGVYMNEVLNWIAGIEVACGAPTWTAIFCLSLLMTQRHIRGGELGPSGSQCGRTGVKRDQTGEMNGGIIVPEMLGRRRQKGSEWHCARILSPTHLTMQPVCPSHHK